MGDGTYATVFCNGISDGGDELTVDYIRNQLTGSGMDGVDASDRRLKDNIEPTTLGLEFINELTPVSYNWIDTNERDNKNHEGLIAQDVETVLETRGMATEDHGIVQYDETNDIYLSLIHI